MTTDEINLIVNCVGFVILVSLLIAILVDTNRLKKNTNVEQLLQFGKLVNNQVMGNLSQSENIN